MKEAQEVRVRGPVIWVLESNELDAVAGGEDESLANAGLMGERADCIGKTSRGDRETLADFDGRGGVVDTYQNE